MCPLLCLVSYGMSPSWLPDFYSFCSGSQLCELLSFFLSLLLPDTVLLYCPGFKLPNSHNPCASAFLVVGNTSIDLHAHSSLRFLKYNCLLLETSLAMTLPVSLLWLLLCLSLSTWEKDLHGPRTQCSIGNHSILRKRNTRRLAKFPLASPPGSNS